MKAKIKVNGKQVISRCKSFMLEVEKLCNKYGITPEMATDNETDNTYIVINIQDFIREDDIKMKIKR